METFVIAALSVVPFVMLYQVYEGPKVWVIWAMGFVLSLYYGFVFVRRNGLKVERRELWLFAWIVVLTISSIFGIHPASSIIGGDYRHQGVLFFFTLFLISLVLTGLTPAKKQIFVWLMAVGVIIESIVVLAAAHAEWWQRPLGTFGEPNAVAGYLALGLYWVWEMPGASKPWKIFLSAVIFAAVCVTGSRTGMAAAFIILIGRAVPFFRQRKQKYGNLPIVLAAGLLVMAAIVVIVSLRQFVIRPASLYENRPLFWTMAARAIAERPVLGWGAEASETVFNYIFTRNQVRLFGFVIDRSHNIFLDVAMWSGIAGLIVFVGWLYQLVAGLYRRKMTGRLWPLLAWLVFACFQPLGAVHWLQLIILAAV